VEVELRPSPDPDVTAAVGEAIARARIDLARLPTAYSSPWRRAGLTAGVDRVPARLRALAAQHAGSQAGIVESGDPGQGNGDEQRPPRDAVAPRSGGGEAPDSHRHRL
jgi:hypothetical protein